MMADSMSVKESRPLQCSTSHPACRLKGEGMEGELKLN